MLTLIMRKRNINVKSKWNLKQTTRKRQYQWILWINIKNVTNQTLLCMHYFKGTISTCKYSLNWNTFQFLLNTCKINTYTYVCIHTQLFLFLNKLPQKFSPRNTQKVIWIDCPAREKAINVVKRCTRIFCVLDNK